MIYEMRVYDHEDGRADEVQARFEAEVMPRFAGHGIELVGAFRDEAGRLTYLTRFADDAARRNAWASFGSDAGWLAAKSASEANGPLIARQEKTVLTPVLTGLPIG